MTANVAPFRRREREAITQRELKTLYDLEQQYLDAKSRYLAKPDNYELEREFEDVRADYHAQRDRIRIRIVNGAPQQPGKYAMRPKIFHRRSVSYKSEVIRLKGEKYQQRLLNNATPKAYTKLEFEDIGSN